MRPSVPANDEVFEGWPSNAGSAYIRNASPLAHVQDGDATGRFFLLHGDSDADVLSAQATRMGSAVSAASLLHRLVVATDADHVFDPVPPALATSPRFTSTSPGTETPTMMTMIADFFDSVANGSAAAVALFRTAISEHGAQIPPKPSEPGAAKRRFTEAY